MTVDDRVRIAFDRAGRDPGRAVTPRGGSGGGNYLLARLASKSRKTHKLFTVKVSDCVSCIQRRHRGYGCNMDVVERCFEPTIGALAIWSLSLPAFPDATLDVM